MSEQLEFFIEPLGKNRFAANEAIWEFLALRGEGSTERAYPAVLFERKKHSCIRVTREEMQVIVDTALQFGFHFQILSIHPKTQEVKRHFSTRDVSWEIKKRKLSQYLEKQRQNK